MSNSSVMPRGYAVSGADKVPQTSRCGGGQTYRMIIFVVGPFGLGFDIETEGNILDRCYDTGRKYLLFPVNAWRRPTGFSLFYLLHQPAARDGFLTHLSYAVPWEWSIMFWVIWRNSQAQWIKLLLSPCILVWNILGWKLQNIWQWEEWERRVW
jgi:hypothetical protein